MGRLNQVLLVLIAVLLAVLAAQQAGVLSPGGGAAPLGGGGGGTATDAPASDDGSSTPDPAASYASLNSSVIEQRVLERVNEYRSSSSELQQLRYRSWLRQLARNHSNDMAVHEFVGHQSSDGASREERYAAAGLDQRCTLSSNNGNWLTVGAEAVARVPFDDLAAREDVFAREIVNAWLDNEERQALDRTAATEGGVGVVVGDDAVYATLELC